MTLLQMSLSGGVLILVITLLRVLLLNRLPRRTFPVLWAVAAARLLIPVSLPSPTSIYNLLQSSTKVQERIYTTQAANLLPVSPATPSTAGAVAQAAPNVVNTAEATTAAVSGPVIPVQTLLWLIGAVTVFAVFTVAYVRSWRQFRESVPVETPFIHRWLLFHPLRRKLSIRQLDRISAPLTYGIFRPVILLPGNTDWENEVQLSYILEHEFVHICRFDSLFKLVLAAAVCIHWCNPLVWVMLILANRDIELSCDAAVLRHMNGENRRDYALTLISLEERKSGFPALYSSFSKNAIEERVRSIMKHKKSTVILSLAAVVLVVCVAVLFATSAVYKTVYASAETDAEALTDGTSGISDSFAGHDLNEDELVFNTGERFFFDTLDNDYSMETVLALMEDGCYWVLLVQNTGEAAIAVDAGGAEGDSSYFVEPGETQAIYSNGPWIRRDCILGFSSPKRMQGYLDCYRSSTPLLPEQAALTDAEDASGVSREFHFSLEPGERTTAPAQVIIPVDSTFSWQADWEKKSPSSNLELALHCTTGEKNYTHTISGTITEGTFASVVPVGSYTLEITNPENNADTISGTLSYHYNGNTANYAYSNTYHFYLDTKGITTFEPPYSFVLDTDFSYSVTWSGEADKVELLLRNEDIGDAQSQTIRGGSGQGIMKNLSPGRYTLQLSNLSTAFIGGEISIAWQPHLDASTAALLDISDVPYDTTAIEVRKAEIQTCISSGLFAEGSENGASAKNALSTLDGMLETIEAKEEFDTEYGPYGITFEPTDGNFYYQGQVVTLLSDVHYTASTNYGSVTVVIQREDGMDGEISDVKIYTGTTYRMENRSAYLTINEDTNEFLLNLSGNATEPLMTGTVAYGQDGEITATAEDGRTICFQTEDDKTLSYQRKGSSVQTYTYQGTTKSLNNGARFLLDEVMPPVSGGSLS